MALQNMLPSRKAHKTRSKNFHRRPPVKENFGEEEFPKSLLDLEFRREYFWTYRKHLKNQLSS